MASNRQGKMQNFLNYRMRVTLNDSRQMVGQMLAFDKHMNIVLADTEEFRRIKKRQAKGQKPGADGAVEAEEKRTLGLAIVRGANIVSLSVEAPPPMDPSARLGASAPNAAGTAPTPMAAGPGISKPAAGRGNPGLQGPAVGVGGPGPGPAGFGGGFAGFPGRGGPPPGFPPGGPPPGFQGQGFPGAPGGGPPPGFAPPPGFQPPGQGRGFPPSGFGGR